MHGGMAGLPVPKVCVDLLQDKGGMGKVFKLIVPAVSICCTCITMECPTHYIVSHIVL